METSFEAIERAHSRLARKRVLQDVKTLARDTEDLLKATADDLSVSVKEVGSRLVSGLCKAKETYREIGETSVTKGKAVGDWAATKVRRRPYESLSGAFAVGLVIGILLSRR